MERISVSELKKSFHDVVLLVGNAKQRVVVNDRHGARVGIVPLEDLALLESLDNGHVPALERIALPELKRHFTDDLAKVASGAERIVVQEHDQDMAAVVPERDLTLLENLDQRLDIEAAKRLLQEKLENDEDE
ncbi:MAG: hypothetical protein U1E76_07595 [Planctomycetota bacterium]